MPLKFYYDLLSQPCRAIYIFLKINNIPFVSCVVDLRKGEHLTKEFAKINPVKKVPVIDHDRFILTESIAIIRYLARKYKISDLWYPADDKLQAKVDEYMSWQHSTIRFHGTMIFRTRVFGPRDDEKINFHLEEMEKAKTTMKEMFLKDRPFICGYKISVADILAICELRQPLAANYDVVGNDSVILTWMERVKNALNPSYDEAHQVCAEIKNAIIGGKL